MPRFALLLLAACSFDADYGHVHVTCSDGVCPSGLTCVDEVCTTPGDASVGSDAHDAEVMHALTCADPGDASGVIHGSTAGYMNRLMTMCGGAIYNGADTVYRIDGPGTVTIGIDTNDGLAAYVIGACTQFPTCETDTPATPSAPLSIALTSGMHLVVVDAITANATGTYTLTITR
jgi:hypothetical protein